jgi:hypothetical protein
MNIVCITIAIAVTFSLVVAIAATCLPAAPTMERNDNNPKNATWNRSSHPHDERPIDGGG